MRRTLSTAAAAALLVLPASALALPFTGTLSVQYASDTIPALSVSGSAHSSRCCSPAGC